MNEKDFKHLVGRIEKLEKAVFNAPRKAASAVKSDKEYTGATGGMRLLAVKGFFKSKRTLGEVHAELAKQGYQYSMQAIQMGINRLAKPSGPLVTFKVTGRKVYAQRK